MHAWRWHLALIVLLAVLGYGQLLVLGTTPYSPHSDFVAGGLASKQVLYRNVQSGHGIAFWRADQLSGYAAFSNPNSLYTHPFHMPFWWLSPQVAAGPLTWMHFVLSALAFYALGAVLGVSAWARLVMAVAGLFNAKLILATYAGFLFFMPSIAIVAGLFAAFLRVWQAPDRGAWLAFSAMAYLCLHGHPQVPMYAAAVFGAWSLGWSALRVAGGEARSAGRSMFVLASGGVLALGLCAHVLVPLVDETSLVTRGEGTYEGHLAGHSIGVRQLATLFLPDVLGSPRDHSYPTDELWEDTMGFGFVALLLAGAAVWLCRRRPLVLACASSLVAVLWLACDTPLLRFLFEHLPGLNYLRYPGRILFLAPVFGISLAGFGLDALHSRIRSRGRASAFLGLVLALMSVEGVVYARRYVTTKPSTQAFPVPAYARVMARDASTYRVLPIGRPALNYGWAAPLGLQLVTGYDHINYRHYQVYMDVLRQGVAGPARAAGWVDVTNVARMDLLDALNVKYVVSHTELKTPPDRMRELGRWRRVPAFFFFYGVRDRATFLYENQKAQTRAYFVEKVEYVDDRSEIAAFADTDITRVALVHDPSKAGLVPVAQAGRASVGRIRSRDGHLDLSVETDTPRFLVISEIWHPGWRASLDDQPLPLARSNVALMGAWLPAGHHHVVLSFEPPRWLLGLGLSAGASVVWLLVLLSRARQHP